MFGRANRGLDREQLEQALGGARRALQVADHFADRAHGAGDDRGIEHEGRQLAGAQLAGHHVVPADPQDDADRAEDEQDHRRHQDRALPDSRHGRVERRLDARREPPPVFRLVAVRLDRADLVQRLVHVRAHVADAILACPRELPHAASEQDDRNDDHRHAGQHQQRELRARDREHRESAGEQQHVADRHRRAGTDDGVEHRRVVDEARDHVAGARRLVVSGRQRQQVVEHRAPQVGGDPLADPRHEVEARERRAGHHGNDAQHQRQRAIELARVAGAESAVDHAFQALTDGEHRARPR